MHSYVTQWCLTVTPPSPVHPSEDTATAREPGTYAQNLPTASSPRNLSTGMMTSQDSCTGKRHHSSSYPHNNTSEWLVTKVNESPTSRAAWIWDYCNNGHEGEQEREREKEQKQVRAQWQQHGQARLSRGKGRRENTSSFSTRRMIGLKIGQVSICLEPQALGSLDARVRPSRLFSPLERGRQRTCLPLLFLVFK